MRFKNNRGCASFLAYTICLHCVKRQDVVNMAQFHDVLSDLLSRYSRGANVPSPSPHAHIHKLKHRVTRLSTLIAKLKQTGKSFGRIERKEGRILPRGVQIAPRKRCLPSVKLQVVVTGGCFIYELFARANNE